MKIIAPTPLPTPPLALPFPALPCPPPPPPPPHTHLTKKGKIKIPGFGSFVILLISTSNSLISFTGMSSFQTTPSSIVFPLPSPSPLQKKNKKQKKLDLEFCQLQCKACSHSLVMSTVVYTDTVFFCNT